MQDGRQRTPAGRSRAIRRRGRGAPVDPSGPAGAAALAAAPATSGTGASPAGIRPLVTRVRGLLLGLLVLVTLAGGWNAHSASAGEPRTLSFSSADSDFAFDPDAAITFDAVKTFLDGNSSATFDLGIPGLDDLLEVPMDWDAGADALDQHVIALTSGPLPQILPEGTPLRNLDIDLLFALRWDDAVDETPDVVLALKTAAGGLEELFPDWAEIPGLPGETLDLGELVLPLTPVPGTVLDPAQLPASVRSFFDIGAGPLSETKHLDAAMNLVGELDLTQIPVLQEVAAFLGVDLTDAVEISGSLAGDAARIFADGATTDLSQLPVDEFSIDGPLEIDDSTLPDWLGRAFDDAGVTQIPEFRFRYVPGPNPGDAPSASLQVHDALQITAGGELPQPLIYDIDVADMVTGSGIAVDLAAPTLQLPYALAGLFPNGLQDVRLQVALDRATGTFAGSFAATTTIEATPTTLRVQIDDDPEATRALATLSGPLPIGDAVTWLTGDAFPGGNFGSISFQSAAIDDIELSYDAGGDTEVFGLHTSLSGVEAFSADLRVRLLVGVQRGAGSTAVLAAVRVDDESCSGDCIHLSEVLPLPGPDGGLAVDVQFPAVNFYTMVPGTATLDSTRLGPIAQDFLKEVLALDALDAPIRFDFDATFATDLTTAPLDPLLDSLGITDAPESVRLEGAFSFALGELDDAPTAGLLQDFRVQATMGGISAAPFAGFPTWLDWPDVSTGEWLAYLQFDARDPSNPADDTLALGASIDHIDIGDIGDPAFDPPPFRLDASFAGQPAADDWTITARAALDAPWPDAFGITWLDVEALLAEVTIVREPAAGGSPAKTTPSARIRGEFALCGTDEPDAPAERLAVQIELLPDSTTLTVDLLTSVTADDVMACLFPDADLTLPDFVTGIGIGPGTLTVTVDGDSASVDLVGSLAFQLPYENDPRPPISVSLFAGAGFSLSPFELQHVTVAVRPNSEIGLSRFLPPDLPLPLVGPDCAEDEALRVLGAGCDHLDFLVVPPLAPGEEPTTGFGFAFSFSPGGGSVPLSELSESARDWFSPLYGGKTAGRSLDSGPTVLGAFGLPAPLDTLAESLGFEKNILASGNLPIPGLSAPSTPPALNLALSFEVNEQILQHLDFVDALAVDLVLKAGPKGVAIQLNLDGTLRLMQGIDPAATAALDDLVQQLPDALTGDSAGFDFGAFEAEPAPHPDEPEAEDFCPRGGVIGKASSPDADDPLGEERYFCYDLLDVRVGAEIGFEPPAKIFVALEGDITSVAAAADPNGGWAPLGFEEVLVRQIRGRVEIGVDPSKTPTPVSVVFSALVNGKAFGKNMAAALQAGVNLGVVTAGPVPAPVVRPTVESFGLLLSLPDGLRKDDLVGLYELLAPAFGGTAPGAAELGALPDVGVRDLFLSVSPLGVDRLCIEPGISLKGDLYVYTGDPDASEPPPVCGDDGQAPDVPENQCLEKREEGCVASMLFSLTLRGLIAEGTVPSFDLSPIGIEFTDDLEVIFRLTLDEQVIRLAGGARVGLPAAPGPITEVWASGRMAFEAHLSEMRFAGQLNAFGFEVLADGVLGFGSHDPLALFAGEFGPELKLHVVLDAPELDLPKFSNAFGGADFADAVTPLVLGTLDELAQVVELLDRILTSFSSDPLGTLLGLPAELTAAGVDVPPEITTVVNRINSAISLLQTKVDDANDDAIAGKSVSPSPTFDRILNGYRYNGLPGYTYPQQRTCVAGIQVGPVFLTTFVWDPTKPISKTNPSYLLGTEDDDGRCWTVEGVLRGFWTEAQCIGFEVAGGCYFIPPFEISGICATAFPQSEAWKADSPSGTKCTKAEIDDEIEQIFGGLLGDVLDAAGAGSSSLGLPDLVEVIDVIRGFLASSAPGPIIGFECAEFELDLQAFGDSRVLVALDAALFGQELEFGVDWAFRLGDLLALDPEALSANAGDLVADFWRYLTQGGTPVTCAGVDPAVFGEGGIDFGAQLDHLAGPDGEPPAPPPPALAATTSVSAVDENQPFDLTISYDRALTDTDGARTVGIDWDRDGTFSADETVAFAVGDRTKTLAHTYRDDDPTGTTADAYTIAAAEASPGGSSATKVVTVRNVRPVVTTSLAESTIQENDVASLTVDFTDVGPDDTHTVRIFWGDGTPATVVPNAVTGTRFDHTYRDDDPTDTPHDTYAIEVVVTDDDRGAASRVRSIRVDNVPPGAEDLTLQPDAVDEGEAVTFEIAFSDVGPDDTHTVEVDFDGDGTFDATEITDGGARTASATHLFADDNPTATPMDTVPVTVRVTDDDGGVVEEQLSVTIHNVAPLVCATVDPDGFGDVDPEADVASDACPEATAVTIDEGGTATVTAGFLDPGIEDTHVVTIDWGDAAVPDTVFGGPDGLSFPTGSRAFSTTAAYGDNGVFDVTVTVTDDDGGVGSARLAVTVDNVDPSTAIDESSTVLADGPDDDVLLDSPTLLTRAGLDTPIRATATDPGSDDLTFRWTWDRSGRFDDTRTSTKHKVNPPADDPSLSPTLQPRDVTDEASHAWAQPCLYEVGLEVTDDDGGVGSDSIWVVVTGVVEQLRNPGYWYNQLDFSSKKRNTNDFDAATLGCYLEITSHMSPVFGSYRSVDTFEEARDVLNTRKTSDDREIMVRQLLTAWLNFANGALEWDELVDTDGDKVPDTPFATVIRHAEALRLDPTSSRSELLAQEQLLERINGGR